MLTSAKECLKQIPGAQSFRARCACPGGPGKCQAVDIDTEIDEIGPVSGDLQSPVDACLHPLFGYLPPGDGGNALLLSPLPVPRCIHESVDAELDDVGTVHSAFDQ